MTSPRPRPHLAPTAGATSQGDLAPPAPLLRRGAMSRGDLNTTNNHTTSPHPPGATTTITATCPTHGRQTFIYCHLGQMHACPKLVDYDPNDTNRRHPRFCGSVILDEHVTPDGADVVDIRQALPIRGRAS